MAPSGVRRRESGIGTKTRTSILETPQSVSVVTREQIEMQQPASASRRCATWPAPTASAMAASAGSWTSRAYAASTPITTWMACASSAMSTWTPQIDPYTLERIEVLRGPSSFLYGQGTGGGVVNQVSRRPRRESLARGLRASRQLQAAPDRFRQHGGAQ